MNLTFYNVSDDPRVVSKKLGTAVASVNNAIAKTPMNVESPAFVLTGFNSSNLFNTVNYVYCKELSRYYFISDIIQDLADKCEFHCTEDVLMTYKDAILDADVIVFNQSRFDLADSLIPDSRLPMQANTESRTFAFEKGEIAGVGLQNWSFVLNCFGGQTG